MKFWIVGTDTNVGKTTVSAWICLHTKYSYWKPVQTGGDSDSSSVKKLSSAIIYPESLKLKEPLSPHLAAEKEGVDIITSNIVIPNCKNLVIEAAGGLLVPLNQKEFYIDFIKQTKLPVILVARSSLGTINHACLSVEALKSRKIEMLGVIVNGEKNPDNVKAIEKYSSIKVLAEFDIMKNTDKTTLYERKLPQKLKDLFE
jgi:dethiobiotin synthetase